MNIEKEFKTLKYFVDGYYNQSVYKSEFDKEIRLFKEEPEDFITGLKDELRKLQTILDSQDRETWEKIKVFLEENSLRPINFEDGQGFINQVIKGLNSD